MEALIPATALVLDIRGFTPRLQSYLNDPTDEDFPGFVGEFFRAAVTACRKTFLPTGTVDRLWINSTGDGVVAVFLECDGDEGRPFHALRGYLAGLQLMESLPDLFHDHGYSEKDSKDYPFGIGVESGHVQPAGFEGKHEDHVVETFLGSCINIAARLEGVTKTFDRTCMIVGMQNYSHLCQELLEVDYEETVLATESATSREEHHTAFVELAAVSAELLCGYLGRVNLRGAGSRQVFRVSPTLHRSGSQRLIHRIREILHWH